MNKTEYSDYKYVMQDVSQLYLGARYTYEELQENEDVPFKLKAIVERYVKTEIAAEVSLDSHFYYMEPKGFVYQTYKQLKTKVKASILKEKKPFLGQAKKQYDTVTLPLEKFVEILPEEKQRQGMMIQEICISKIALMSFSL